MIIKTTSYWFLGNDPETILSFFGYLFEGENYDVLIFIPEVHFSIFF